MLAQIEAELTASKARILEILSNEAPRDPETVATEANLPAQTHVAPYQAASGATILARQRELRSIITSFEKRVGDAYDLGIMLRRFPETAPLRLHSVTFFGSGAVSFMGLDGLGRSANLYDTLDHFSVILKKVRRLNKSRARKPVEFYTVIDQD